MTIQHSSIVETLEPVAFQAVTTDQVGVYRRKPLYSQEQIDTLAAQNAQLTARIEELEGERDAAKQHAEDCGLRIRRQREQLRQLQPDDRMARRQKLFPGYRIGMHVTKLHALWRASEARADAAEARVSLLEEVLAPFAADASEIAPAIPDATGLSYEGFPNLGLAEFTIADLRRARAALGKEAG